MRGVAERATPLAALAVAAATVLLVRDTLLPGVSFWDTAEFQTVPPILGTAHPTGYPAYVILGFLANIVLAPLGEPAFRMNVLSAIYVALATAFTVLLVGRLTGSLALAVAAAIGLAGTPVVWSIATHADAHALHLALVAALAWLLVEWAARRADASPTSDRWLLAAAACFGIAAANHSLTLLLVPPVAVYVFAVDRGTLDRPGFVARCLAVAVGVMTLLYLELPLRAGPFRAPLVYGHPETLDGFLYVALGVQFAGSLVEPLAGLSAKLDALVSFGVGELGPLALVVPVAFLATLRRAPHYALLSGLAFGLTTLFAASYENADISRYYLGPAFFAWTWLAVLAAVLVDTVVGEAGGKAWTEEPDATDGRVWSAPGRPNAQPTAGPAGSRLALGLAGILLVVPTVGDLERRAAIIDRSGDVSAELWTDAVLAALPPDAVVLSWWSYSTPLWYAQHVEGRRPDIRIVDDRTRIDEGLGDVSDVIDANIGLRPVYVIRLADDLAALSQRYDLEPVSPEASTLYRVVGRSGPAT